MRSDSVVVTGVRFQNATQMRLAQHNHMIDALAPDRADQPFSNAILPRLARFLKARGIECLVVDAASMQVNRRARRAKTDRIDVGMLLRALIAWSQGDRHVWSLVRVPNVDEEDLRRSHRERDRLVCERTAHINRIKGLLFGQGISRH
jgi:transposase